MNEGDLSLVDEINRMQLAILGAISEAFKTPEVVAMFARRQPNELRQRYHELERDYRLQKLPADAFHIGAVEILVALKKLGEELTDGERAFLAEHGSGALKDFERVDAESQISGRSSLLSQAGAAISEARK